ncbi:PREDICTED: uncharacterized protein LOC106124662 isoform X2 [Papilio xuthus]|uniref:Uncharacterized protein LOC106124662 isoform X2 n=1 Tax=Papilio xuthus TaxID=66420 RepID=A0AAJ7EGY9_PAPXU|nr:PREDICTED: uncharacterized protein LOC106124662 isoform X2 [Papilio xuthus]XP_013177012.1 PREDICTED: uncharacterized protein LOC106124662 isoform X2 [Papilio xuthus]
MSDESLSIQRLCSSVTQSCKGPTHTKSYRSDTDVLLSTTSVNNRNDDRYSIMSKQYYKMYEHDEIPVQDNTGFSILSKSGETGKGDRKLKSGTTLDLEQIEMNLNNTLSYNLHADSSFAPSLESNIKLFKTTVQEIFDKFYHCMSDIEQYKLRFNKILTKIKDDPITDMENFIKDMLQDIISSDSSVSFPDSKIPRALCSKDATVEVNCEANENYKPSRSNLYPEGLKTTIEAYRNDNYKSDSNTDDVSSSHKSKKGVFYINLLNSHRCVQIKLNNRDMVSEINIRDHMVKDDKIDEAVSADNIKKLKAKEMEAMSLRDRNVDQGDEKDIPVRIANPKKNIHLDQDFTNDVDDESKRSIIYKICNYFCKKLRRAC